jgi:hypothetical protein
MFPIIITDLFLWLAIDSTFSAEIERLLRTDDRLADGLRGQLDEPGPVWQFPLERR